MITLMTPEMAKEILRTKSRKDWVRNDAVVKGIYLDVSTGTCKVTIRYE